MILKGTALGHAGRHREAVRLIRRGLTRIDLFLEPRLLVGRLSRSGASGGPRRPAFLSRERRKLCRIARRGLTAVGRSLLKSGKPLRHTGRLSRAAGFSFRTFRASLHAPGAGFRMVRKRLRTVRRSVRTPGPEERAPAAPETQPRAATQELAETRRPAAEPVARETILINSVQEEVEAILPRLRPGRVICPQPARLSMLRPSGALPLHPAFRYCLPGASDQRAIMTERASERPTKQDLDQLLGRTRERISFLFRRHRCSPETATELLREGVTALTQQWGRVRDRDQWLLDRIEKAVVRTVDPSPGKPRDEEPPS